MSILRVRTQLGRSRELRRMNVAVRRIWGETTAFLHRGRRFGWIDLLILAGMMGLWVGLFHLAGQWTGRLRPTVTIDLSPLALPRYTLFSLARGLIAYVLSLGFSLAYGYWAAKDRIAERILVPLLDILQSIPVLGFMPGLVLALVALFPSTNMGLELAAILMIFTGQAWNMTFSFYNSVRSVPHDQQETATVYRFSTWQRFRWVELPFATMGLVWNSMMSMAGGWFFLMVSEAFVLGSRDFRLPGIGAYMSVAVAQGNVPAMVWAVVAMSLMIVILDQLLWRPVVVWAQRFRVEEGGGAEAASSWFLDWLRGSWLLREIRHRSDRSGSARRPKVRHVEEAGSPIRTPSRAPAVFSLLLFGILVASLLYAAARLLLLFRQVDLTEWLTLFGSGGLTLARVLVAVGLATLWAVPAGLAIGLSPRLSRVLQPVVQVVASFPAPMLFPVAIAVFAAIHVSLGWSSIALMLLGTQWYILFNVIAGAMAIPSDLREAATSYRIKGRQRLWKVYLPSIFPYLVTGWITATGGAWNASIVAEYVTFRGRTLAAPGLGALISQSAEGANFPVLAAGVVTMSVIVVLFNRLVWRRFYRLAEGRLSLSR